MPSCSPNALCAPTRSWCSVRFKSKLTPWHQPPPTKPAPLLALGAGQTLGIYKYISTNALGTDTHTIMAKYSNNLPQRRCRRRHSRHSSSYLNLFICCKTTAAGHSHGVLVCKHASLFHSGTQQQFHTTLSIHMTESRGADKTRHCVYTYINM